MRFQMLLRVLVAGCALTLALLAAAPALARPFPKDFLWGTAISGFQAEMGGSRDQRDTRSDWWAWTHDARNIRDGTVSGDLPERGAGHWNRWRTDVRLADERIGARLFRIGLEWSRIFPRSTRSVRISGAIGRTELEALDRLADQRAVRHYRAVLRGVRAAGMRPFVTMNHFTLPRWAHDAVTLRDRLARAGASADAPPPSCACPRGWLDRATIVEFRKYAAYLAWKLGDGVTFWNPMNEPNLVPLGGYINIPGAAESDFPPKALSWEGVRRSILHLAEAWGLAYDEIRRLDRRSRVVLVHSMNAYDPRRPDDPADRRATRHAEYFFNRMFPDMVVRGRVDANMDGVIGAGERRRGGRKVDVFGVNYYFRARVRGLPVSLTRRIPVFDFIPIRGYGAADCPTECDDLGREIFPAGLREVVALAGEYGLPVLITENGMPDADDDRRPRYLADHVRVLREAMADGVADVRGYLVWALVDNYEWTSGFGPKFGLYGFDPRTLARIPRRRSIAFVSCLFRTGDPDGCPHAGR